MAYALIDIGRLIHTPFAAVIGLAVLFSGTGVEAQGLPSGGGFRAGVVVRGDDGRLTLQTPVQAVGEQSPEQPVKVSQPPKPTPQMGRSTIRVCASHGPGCDTYSLAEALGAVAPGGTVVLAPGTYAEAGILAADRVVLRGESGARLKGVAAEGKAALVIKGDNVVVDGLECSGIAVPDRNGACLRLEGHNLTLRNVYFHDSEEGVLAGNGLGSLIIEDSRFERLGGGGGYSHAIYAGRIESLVLRRSQVLSSRDQGHEVKSRATRTLIEDSVVASLDGVDSRLIDVPNGGEVIIRNSLLEKGGKSVNVDVIGYGLEGVGQGPNVLRLENDTVLVDRSQALLVNGAVGTELSQTRVVGGDQRQALTATWLPDRSAAGYLPYPSLKLRQPSDPVPPPDRVGLKPDNTVRVCLTGGCDYNSLAEAFRQARTGTTILVKTGVYREAGVLTAHLVTVRAEPGVLLRGMASEGKAALLVKGNDTVIEGMECTDIGVADHNGACVRLEGRNLTLRRVYFHDSEEGVLVNDGAGTVTIEDSRFERLGSRGQSHGIYVGQVDAFTLRRSAVTAGRGQGHEVKSRAAITRIEDCLIASQDGVDSRLIDLPNGGEAVVRNSVLEKGPNSANDDAIGYGLEGMAWPVNSLRIENSAMIMDRSPNRLVRSRIRAELHDDLVVGSDYGLFHRLTALLTNFVLPGRFGENASMGAGMRWADNRGAAGLPPFPSMPSGPWPAVAEETGDTGAEVRR